MKTGSMSDVIKVSENGRKKIDLTEYIYITDLGKKFLETKEKLNSKNQQDVEDSQEN